MQYLRESCVLEEGCQVDKGSPGMTYVHRQNIPASAVINEIVYSKE